MVSTISNRVRLPPVVRFGTPRSTAQRTRSRLRNSADAGSGWVTDFEISVTEFFG